MDLHQLGATAQGDQMEASVRTLATALALYYQQLRQGRVPPAIACELALQYQGYLLTAIRVPRAEG